jgi:hypothetical protein
MNNIGGTSRYIAFIDECGDHSLGKIDRDFPLFLLATIIVERQAYAETIIPALGQLKLRYWNHEGVNLHSRDIRKALGPYGFLQVPAKRALFLGDVSALMGSLPYALFVSAVRKDSLSDRYGQRAKNPYDLALVFTMERVSHFLETHQQTELPVVVEARGSNEDKELERVFYTIMSAGTFYIPADRFKALSCPLVFRNKRDNIAGIQLADLCAYPCARHVLAPSHPNAPYDIVFSHVYSKGGVRGWKVFP